MVDHVLSITPNDTVYLLGDLIDRGPSSKEVIDKILELQSLGYKIKPIMGNHERLLLDSMISNDSHEDWFKNAGKRTLKSFGAKDVFDIKPKYIRFFSNLPYFEILDDYVIVHGGLNFEIDNPLEDTDSMVWMRNRKTDKEKIGGRKVIAGHTPLSLPMIKLSLITDYILLDGGCVYNGNPNFGKLVALELNSMELFYLENME